jgi:hypothetical protein
MRHRMTIATSALLLSACGDRIAGPNEPVLVGQYGRPDLPTELLATRAGVELDQICGSYFASGQPARLAADGSFEVHGRYHHGGLINIPGDDEGATLTGTANLAGPQTVTITLTFDAAGAAGDPFTATLTRGEHDTQIVVCAG